MDRGGRKGAEKKKRLVTWRARHNKIYVNLLVEQIRLTNKTTAEFEQATWFHIRDQFNAKTGFDLEMIHLFRQLIALKTRYHSVTYTFAEHDRVSALQAQGFPVLEQPEPKRCPIYDQLCTIFKWTETSKSLGSAVARPDASSSAQAKGSAITESETLSSPASEQSKNSFSFKDCGKALDEIDHDKIDP